MPNPIASLVMTMRWVGGNFSAPTDPVYGPLGVANAINYPGTIWGGAAATYLPWF